MLNRLSPALLGSPFLILLAFVFIVGSSLNAGAKSISKKEAERLTTFFKRRFASNLPPGSQLSVSGYEETAIEGFKKGKLSVSTSRGSGEIPFLVSGDGRYVIIGEVTDTTKFEESPLEGIKQGQVVVNGRPQSLLMSDDGKYVIAGDLMDSTVNPLQAIVDRISLDNVPMKGNRDAEVTVVEYSDFQCPFCRRASEMIPKLLKEYGDKINLVYKQFPLPSHNWAMPASVASVCAYRQGNDEFWEFHDLVFENQKEINLENSSEKFSTYAKEIGLDTEKFKACLDSNEVKAKVRQETDEARSVGVNSTPSFFVNGMLVRGADYSGLKSAIESALARDL